jgi:hypothetical protein
MEHAAAEARHLHTLYLIAGNGGQIDVEERIGWELPDRGDPSDQALQLLNVAFQVLEVEAAVGDCDTRDAGRQALHRGSHRSRVQHIFAHVGAVVHAGEHKLRLFRHEGVERE